MSEDQKPTQQTQPKKGAPIEIPVPKRGDVMDFLEKTAKLSDPDRSRSRVPDQPDDDGQDS